MTTHAAIDYRTCVRCQIDGEVCAFHESLCEICGDDKRRCWCCQECMSFEWECECPPEEEKE